LTEPRAAEPGEEQAAAALPTQADNPHPEPGAVGSATSAADQDAADPRVNEALEKLEELDGMPTAEHPDLYEEVHRRLHGALTELDDD
jgi:hypothetical protein